MSRSAFRLVSFVLFQLIWVAAVLYREQGLWVCIALLVLHCILSPEGKLDMLTGYKAIALGIVVDGSLMLSGVYIFDTPYFPAWLVCLWVGFVLTLRHSLSWLYQKPVIWQIVLGAAGGTLSYLAGARLGAVTLGIDMTYAVLILVTVWGLLFPVLMKMVHSEPKVSYA